MRIIQRECSEELLSFVRTHPYFQSMREGIAGGNILPCLRKNNIDFYEGGACLFRFSPRTVCTDRQYVDGGGTGRRALTTEEQNCQKTFKGIRDNASAHRRVKVRSELAAVHRLFSAFAITRDQSGQIHDLPSQRELALIDIETKFGVDKENVLPGKKIDLVFLTPSHSLLFVEVKGVWNKDVKSKTTAAVERQVKDYEKHITLDSVLDALNLSMATQSILLGKPVYPAIATFSRVPILLLDPSERKQSIGKNNKWLRDRLAAASNWTVASPEAMVIDGTRDPAAAIRAFVEKFNSRK